jgi:hypothetical protein
VDDISIHKIDIPLEWHYPADLPSHYATHFVVQHTEQEFIVSLFQALPPLILKEADLESFASVTAECIARVIVSPDRLEGFIEVLQRNLKSYRELKSQMEQSHE